MSDERVEFWRDPGLDAAISDLISIFTEVEGVELVRLSGMTRRFSQISGKFDMPSKAVDGIIRKLKGSNIIAYNYIMKCPHCGEKSYVIKSEENKTSKLCDTCNTMYALLDGSTLEK
jgi:hypothetical protein